MVETFLGVAGILGVIFQAPKRIFTPFFRYGFGRRYFRLGPNVIIPAAVIAVAIILRAGVPNYVTHAPLRLIPPFNEYPQYQPLIHGSESGLRGLDGMLFFLFGVLLIFLSLVHYLVLFVQRQRSSDPTHTRFWGKSWLALLPPFGALKTSTLQSKIEPGLLLLGGYLLCAWAPLFGMFLLAGGLALGLEELALWHMAKEREFDARDSLVQASWWKADHEVARQHYEKEIARKTARVSRATIARVQEDPHELLSLTPEELESAREQLGDKDFGGLCDRLEPEARRRLASGAAGYQAASRS